MKSVAEEAKADQLRKVEAMSVDERVRLALRLGDDDLAILCSVQGLTREEAISRIRRQRQIGRASSACMDR